MPSFTEMMTETTTRLAQAVDHIENARSYAVMGDFEKASTQACISHCKAEVALAVASAGFFLSKTSISDEFSELMVTARADLDEYKRLWDRFNDAKKRAA